MCRSKDSNSTVHRPKTLIQIKSHLISPVNQAGNKFLTWTRLYNSSCTEPSPAPHPGREIDRNAHMKQSSLDTALNRLRLWQKFAVLALFGVVLVATPFILYVHESGKTIQATRLESSGLHPMRLLMKTLQLTQQHRGLAMITLNGDVSAEARRAALQTDTDRAFEALDAALRQDIQAPALLDAWQEVIQGWTSLEGQVARKSLAPRRQLPGPRRVAHPAAAGEILAAAALRPELRSPSQRLLSDRHGAEPGTHADRAVRPDPRPGRGPADASRGVRRRAAAGHGADQPRRRTLHQP